LVVFFFTLAPPSNPRQDRVVAMVLAATELRVAVLASKLSKASADNVRKRVRRARARELAGKSLKDDAEALSEAKIFSRRTLYRRSTAEKKPKHTANIIHTTHQVDVIKRAELVRLRAPIEAHKGATSEFAALLTGPHARGSSTRGCFGAIAPFIYNVAGFAFAKKFDTALEFNNMCHSFRRCIKLKMYI
jgi:hypothetical protein